MTWNDLLILNRKNSECVWFFGRVCAIEWIAPKWMKIYTNYLRIGTAINSRQSPLTWYDNCCSSSLIALTTKESCVCQYFPSQHAADSGGWLWRSCGCLRHGTSSRGLCRWPTGAVWCSSNAASLGTVHEGGRDGFVFEDDKGRAWTSS